MRIRKVLSAAILLAVFCSCTLKEATPDQLEKQVLRFTADPFIEDDPETKTDIGSGYSFIWSANDTVGIYPNKGNQVYFEMINGAGASKAEFDGGGWSFKPGFVYSSYYPFIGDIYLDATKIRVKYTDQKQVGNNSTANIGPFDFMYSPSKEAVDGILTMTYHHLSTLVRPIVDLPAGEYTKLTLSLDEPLFITEGTYDLTTATDDEAPIVGTASAPEISMGLDVKLAQAGRFTGWMMLAAPLDIIGKMLTVTITNKAGTNYSYTYTPSKQYDRGRIFDLSSPISFAVGSVSIDPSSADLNVGDTQQLSATVLPENLSDRSVTWSSSNPEVASVDANGLVTAKAKGEATITATASDGNTKAECVVTVKDVISHSLILEPAQGSVNVGETLVYSTKLKTVKNGAESIATLDNAQVSWTSSKESIATISEGVATGIAAGTTTIMAQYTPEGEDSPQVATAALSVQTVSVASVSLNKSSLTFNALGTAAAQTLTATVLPENATNKNVTWTSSNTAVATVDQTGKVTPVGSGETTITVKTVDGNKTATCTVTVHIPVTGVSLNKSTLALNVGASETLRATVAPNNATNKKVNWTSNKTSVATVDANGKVTAKAAGSATITATSEDGNKTATCTVTVSDVISHSLDLTPESTTINAGATQTYTVKLTTVKNGTRTTETISNSNSRLTWTSSSNSVATVTNGVATGKAAGTVTITVTYTFSDNSKVSDTATLSVEQVPVSVITLNQTALTLEKGATSTLTATVAPDNATIKTLTWKSSNTSVATVDANGKVTAVAKGTANITATATDGSNKSATCAVTVKISVTGVSVNHSTLSLNVGGTYSDLTATVLPADASDKSVTWSSSNTAVATVDASTGKITAVKAGTADIVATTTDGSKTAKCTLTVKDVVTYSLAITPANSSVYVGSTLTYAAKLTTTTNGTPATTTLSNTAVTWSSSSSAATISTAGVATGVSAGSVTITAKYKPSGASEISATTGLTVKSVAVTGVTLNKTTLSLNTGGSETLTATVAPANATNKNVTWTSSNTSVATVDANGKVTAVSGGNATITVRTADGNKTATCNVSVIIPVTSIKIFSRKLNQEVTSLSLYPYDTDDLSVVCYPENATNKAEYQNTSNQYWTRTPDNDSYLACSFGAITAWKGGVGKTITVKVNVKGLSASCSISILDPAPSPINLGLSVNWGNENLFTQSPSESGRYYTWKDATRYQNTGSDVAYYVTDGDWRLPTDAEVEELLQYCTRSAATVNGVTGVRFTASNGNSIFLPDVGGYIGNDYTSNSSYYWSTNPDSYSSTSAYWLEWNISNHTPARRHETIGDLRFAIRPVSTTVNQIDVTGLTLNKTSMSVYVNETGTITATVTPANATYKTVTWTSSDTSIATVTSDGVVKGIAPGSVTISAKAGNITKKCSVTVYKRAVTSVTLSATSKTLYTGDVETLTATVSPTNATYPTVTWSSANTSVVTVSQTGVVTAVGPGTAKVTATADGKSASCTFTVKQLVTSLSFEKTATTIRTGQSETLQTIILPSNASNKALTWTTSAPSVATVTNGKVAAKSPGTTTITAKTNDGSNLTASCVVTVVSSGKPFPSGTTFDEDAYITYVSNYTVKYQGDNQYINSTVFPCDVSGVKVEMKFQMDNTYQQSSGLPFMNRAHLGSSFCMNNSHIFWEYKYKDDGDYITREITCAQFGSLIGRTDVLKMTATISGGSTTVVVNEQTQTFTRPTVFDFDYVFSYYENSSEDGNTYEYGAGVPDGARLYYVKIWDSSNNLVYFGHACKAVNPDNNTEEYCWYYTTGSTSGKVFARNNGSSRQAFGGGID